MRNWKRAGKSCSKCDGWRRWSWRKRGRRKSLEAQVEIEPDTEATRQWLEDFGPLLETVLIVSQVRVNKTSGAALRVTVTPAAGKKCVRCWRWREDVGADAKHPELCGRCAEVIEHVEEAAL